MSLGQRIEKIESRINSLALRERALLLLAALGIAFVLADTFLLRPLDQRRETTRQQATQSAERSDALTASIARIAPMQNEDPNAELTAQRDALRQQIAQLSQEMATLDSGVLTPNQTLDLLGELLADRDDLRLISLDKLPPESLDPENNGNGIFIHRFGLVIESEFSGMLEYVQLIENLPRGLYWESLSLSVPEWPDNRAEIVLYLLALDEDWLGV